MTDGVKGGMGWGGGGRRCECDLADAQGTLGRLAVAWGVHVAALGHAQHRGGYCLLRERRRCGVPLLLSLAACVPAAAVWSLSMVNL